LPGSFSTKVSCAQRIGRLNHVSSAGIPIPANNEGFTTVQIPATVAPDFINFLLSIFTLLKRHFLNYFSVLKFS
jgi:hypothetical protein